MRRASAKDVPLIVDMVAAYFEENKDFPMQRYFTFDRNYTGRYFDDLIASGDCIGAVDPNGVCLGRVTHTWIGPNLVAEGIIWYVRPRARGGLLAWRLLKAFDQEADSRGALVALNALHNPAFKERVSGIVKLAGYKPYSENYVKEFFYELGYKKAV